MLILWWSDDKMTYNQYFHFTEKWLYTEISKYEICKILGNTHSLRGWFYTKRLKYEICRNI